MQDVGEDEAENIERSESKKVQVSTHCSPSAREAQCEIKKTGQSRLPTTLGRCNERSAGHVRGERR